MGTLELTQALSFTQELSRKNRVHYVRDVILLEDACQVAKGRAPHALAALRNGLMTQLRWHGVTNIARALRHLAARVSRPLRLVGIGL